MRSVAADSSPPERTSLSSHTLHYAVGALLLKLETELSQVLLVVGVGVVRLPVTQKLRVTERPEGHVVHVDQERPSAVLRRSGREVVPVALRHDRDPAAISTGDEPVDLGSPQAGFARFGGLP